MASSSVLESVSCPVCRRFFRTNQAVNAHLRMAKSCQSYRSGKLPETSNSQPENLNDSLHSPPASFNADAHLFSDSEEEMLEVIDDDFGVAPFADFHDQQPAEYSFLQPEVNIPMGHAGPGPSTMAFAAEEKHRKLQIPITDEDEVGFAVEFVSAGAIIRMDANIHQRWKAAYENWRKVDEDEDISMEDQTSDTTSSSSLWMPFASELDWRVARWAVEENVGQGVVDRLLEIPGVRCNNLQDHLPMLTASGFRLLKR